MGKNVATLELEFYFTLLKLHTEELFLLINETKSWFLSVFLKPHMYKRFLKNDSRWYLKTVSFHSKLKMQSVPINTGIQQQY